MMVQDMPSTKNRNIRVRCWFQPGEDKQESNHELTVDGVNEIGIHCCTKHGEDNQERHQELTSINPKDTFDSKCSSDKRESS